MVGFGKVGSAYSQHMGESFNRAPTIRIPAGTGVGVLIMGDLTLPTNPQVDDEQSNGSHQR
jgi:intracellular multiplication protein IcmE